mmetsp:Transcript_34812/g.33122  ORF Transcript_34812/g.33122 Transcript_34812/m.33122 type:complete len:413 (-) Transcript_34812:84-1322(-)|eukprot:CAMPEP_0119037076 /NCGR_PEP_ID=MMETSP1177-20130426/5193_1 /TAXON_ID=2985 /ORGANISM="Ochromonas sp, Strain CCMP1899" /LENGTH=412 /DNA_ID=CAMNT_0006997823 /DNA_START=99 /DNA_END=1337 /DNA_ORIENTATION=-
MMRSICSGRSTFRLLQSPKVSKFVRCAATATREAEESLLVDKVKENEEIASHFPWRSQPSHTEETSMVENIRSYITSHICKILINEFLINRDSAVGPRSTYMEVDFIMGAKAAFETSMTAIFNHKKLLAIQILNNKNKENMDERHSHIRSSEASSINKKVVDDINKSENNETKFLNKFEEREALHDDLEPPDNKGDDGVDRGRKMSDGVEGSREMSDEKKINPDDRDDLDDLIKGIAFVPDLTGIFDKKLAHFFESAIDITQKKNLSVFHSVEKIGTPSIEKYDVLFASKRSMNFNKLKRYRALGLISVIIPRNKDDYTQDDTPRHVRDWLEMREHVTVRLNVTIPMTETFYVKDEKTGVVVQGSEEPQHTSHNVLFETNMNYGGDDDGVEWSICDIDDWLEGNEFWISNPQ